jgi:hypothetical protein
MSTQAKRTFLTNWKSLKKDINKFVRENNIVEVQNTVKKMVNQAEKDLKKYVDKDYKVIKKKFDSERRQVEKLLNRTLQAEVKRAKSFLEKQKKEITRLQTKLDKMAKAADKATKKKVTKKKATKKKTTKKVAKKATKKKATKKKTTKKK